jgi:hypothetical protein
MVDTSGMLSGLKNFGSGAMNVGIIIFVAVFIALIVIGFMFLYFKKKRYDEYTCIIWFRDGFGQLQQVHDKAGVFLDKKTNNKRLFLQKANVGLSADNIPYVMTGKGKRFVYLYRNGLKNFYFLKPDVTMTGVTVKVGEEDVNWAINAYERGKQTFMNNTLLQYLPFITLAFVSVIILIIFVYFFKNFSVLKEVAVSFEHSASILASIGQNTTVIPS